MIGKVQDMMSAAVVIGAAAATRSVSAPDKEAAPAEDAAAKQPKAPKAPEKVDRPEAVPELGREVTPEEMATEKAKEKAAEKKEKLDEQTVDLKTKELNEIMASINCDLRFRYNKEVDLMSVQMINKETDDVIKELPPEDMIKNMEQAKEWIGAFLDKNA
jgi:flagellar protein FlaG